MYCEDREALLCVVMACIASTWKMHGSCYDWFEKGKKITVYTVSRHVFIPSKKKSVCIGLFLDVLINRMDCLFKPVAESRLFH